MTLEETEAAITDAIMKAALFRPGSEAEEALWVQTTAIYLTEFFRRARMTGMDIETARRGAWKAMRKRVRDETVARVLSYEIPVEASHDQNNLLDVRSAGDDSMGSDRSLSKRVSRDIDRLPVREPSASPTRDPVPGGETDEKSGRNP